MRSSLHGCYFFESSGRLSVCSLHRESGGITLLNDDFSVTGPIHYRSFEPAVPALATTRFSA